MMTPHYFAVSIIFAVVTFIGHGRAQLFETSPCRLHDGSRGVCKNIEQCQTITDAIIRNALRFDNIVMCSFVGTTQIVCCADEKPKQNPSPHAPPSKTNADFVFEDGLIFGQKSNLLKEDFTKDLTNATKGLIIFPNFLNEHRQKSSSTTLKPITTTTINPFWSSWSATQPNTLNETENEHNHSPALIKTNNNDSLLPWMKDILNNHSTTERPIQTKTELQHTLLSTKSPVITSASTEFPNWLKDVLDGKTSSTTTEIPNWLTDVLSHHTTNKTTNSSNDFANDHETTTQSWNNGTLRSYSTTTVRTPAKSNTGDGFLNNSSSGGDGIEFIHLIDTGRSDGFPIRRLPTDKPKPPTPNASAPNTSVPKTPMTNAHISVRKSDAACQKYAELPVVSGLTWQILNGVPTSPGEFPWMAAIGYESSERPGEYDYNCGGTIISERYILTAAHCNSARATAKTVRMGRITLFTNDDENEPLDLNIETFINHPKYSSFTKVNDIALIRVEEPIKFTEFIRPACLRTDITDVSPNVELIITGWGTTSALKTQRATVLLKTNVTAVSISTCNETLLEFNRLPDLPALRNGLNMGQVCAYDPKAASDACQGDSGGPLQMFEQSSAIATVVGVVSFGASCGTELPGVYTRVAFYIDWIESIVWPN